MGIFFKSPLICLMTSPGIYKIQVILIRRKLKLQNNLQKCKPLFVKGSGAGLFLWPSPGEAGQMDSRPGPARRSAPRGLPRSCAQASFSPVSV